MGIPRGKNTSVRLDNWLAGRPPCPPTQAPCSTMQECKGCASRFLHTCVRVNAFRGFAACSTLQYRSMLWLQLAAGGVPWPGVPALSCGCGPLASAVPRRRLANNAGRFDVKRAQCHPPLPWCRPPMVPDHAKPEQERRPRGGTGAPAVLEGMLRKEAACRHRARRCTGWRCTPSSCSPATKAAQGSSKAALDVEFD